MALNRLVHDVGAHAGPPELTPRTLRHSFLRILADKTHDIDDVMRYGVFPRCGSPLREDR